ncbi:hypothetical protein [Pararhizobium qamdonense]|uniref:hypothetical protein n=1 Tax=Pararhizobium qamdonense TaxID=3031126 RepID=UPI0023E27175|nr:hypothetical protein [Pararhizobium qamdonense]
MTEYQQTVPDSAHDGPREEISQVALTQAPHAEHVVWVEAKARLRYEILEKELDLLRARLDIIRSQAGVVLKSGGAWIDSSARSQLGPYPWAKLAALATGPYIVAKAVRVLPLGSLAAAVVPLVAAAVKQRAR